MKYALNDYVNAFTEAVRDSGGGDSVVSNFVKLLARNGDISKKEKILDAIHRKLVNDKGGRWIIIESARKMTEKSGDKVKEMFSSGDHIIFKINPDLVAGVRITVNGEEELDNSLRSKLNKLFK